MTEEQMKRWIDNAPYSQLLHRWRTAPLGDPFFRDEMGSYYREVMQRKRKEIGDAEAVRISKEIGW